MKLFKVLLKKTVATTVCLKKKKHQEGGSFLSLPEKND